MGVSAGRADARSRRTRAGGVRGALGGMGKVGGKARDDARFVARHPRIEAERTDSRAPKGVCRRFATSQASRPLPARWIPACRKAFAGASVLRKLHVHPSARRLPARRKAFDGASILPKLRVRRLRDRFPRAERRLPLLCYFASSASAVCGMASYAPKGAWQRFIFVLCERNAVFEG